MRRIDINLDQKILQVRAYEPGRRLLVNDQAFTESIIITPKSIMTGLNVNSIADLTRDALQTILDLESDILLIGTGPKHHLIQAIFSNILSKRPGVEIMSTGAACRTFNALILEERSVIAVLIIA